MRVLLTATSFSPKYGGPAKSISQLSLNLCLQGIEVGLWASDNSLHSSAITLDHEKLSILSGKLTEAFTLFKPHLLHDNGIWLSHNHRASIICKRKRIPRVVSPRGMLLPKAMQTKRIKKTLAWFLYQRRDLENAQALHTTSDAELSELNKLLPNAPAFCVPNGIQLDSRIAITSPVINNEQVNTLLFVGRLCPIKGIPLLIEAWDELKPLNWKVRLVGPDEKNYSAHLRSLIRSKNLDHYFEFVGEQTGDELEYEFAAATALILPSHSENFGMVIGEALSRKLPVIATEGSPWQSLVSNRCGWWVPTTKNGISLAIKNLIVCTREELRLMGERGRLLAESQFGWPSIAREMIHNYKSIISCMNC